jgi:plastocyanin
MHRAFVWTFAWALALFLLAAPIAVVAGGCVNHSLADDGAASTIAIKDCSFSPTVTRVPAGATVTWKNVDYLPHVVSGIGWGSVNGYTTADTSTLHPGATFAQTFTTSGVYPYACYLHPGMSGVVIVGDEDPTASIALSTAASPVPAKVNESPPSDTPWSYLLIALFGLVAVGGYGIALVRRF